jgi:RNA polymerase sigma factor (sigma-70 family)
LGEARFALTYGSSLYDEARGVPFGAYVTMVIRHRLARVVTEWRRGGRLDFVFFTDLAKREAGGDVLPFDPPCRLRNEPGEEVAARELLERVRGTLPPRWYSLLELYYSEECTLQEIGEQVGLSRERVRQLIAKAIRRAREHFPECDRRELERERGIRCS